MTYVIIIYLIISLFIAIWDLDSLRRQDEYFMNIPQGDLEYHKRVPILGIHNYLFFPSLLFIGGWILFCKIFNSIND